MFSELSPLSPGTPGSPPDSTWSLGEAQAWLPPAVVHPADLPDEGWAGAAVAGLPAHWPVAPRGLADGRHHFSRAPARMPPPIDPATAQLLESAAACAAGQPVPCAAPAPAPKRAGGASPTSALQGWRPAPQASSAGCSDGAAAASSAAPAEPSRQAGRGRNRESSCLAQRRYRERRAQRARELEARAAAAEARVAQLELHVARLQATLDAVAPLAAEPCDELERLRHANAHLLELNRFLVGQAPAATPRPAATQEGSPA